jgi:mono/diheme cytochrome c family protein
MQFRHLASLALAASLLAVGCQGGDGDKEGVSPKVSATPPAAGTPTAAATFAEVQPILTRNCAGCHGARPKEGYDMRTLESIMKGGEDGPLIKAGDPAGSLLIQVLRGQEGHPKMPPSGPLDDADVQKIEAWIKAGAKA